MAAAPSNATDEITRDTRDLVAAVLLGMAAALVVLGWLAALVLDAPPSLGTRTDLLAVSAPGRAVLLGLLAWAGFGLTRREATVGRVLTVALAVQAALELARTGAGAWSGGGLEVDAAVALMIAEQLGVVAAGSIVVTIWQDRGAPSWERPTSAVARWIVAATVVLAATQVLPTLTAARTLAGRFPLVSPFRASAVGVVGPLGTVLVVLLLGWAAASLMDVRAARATALLVVARKVASSTSALVSVWRFDLDVRWTAWAVLGLVAGLAIATAAVARARQASSDTA